MSTSQIASRSALIGTDQFGLCQYVTLHGVLYVLLAGSRLQVEHFVQSIEFEEVAVGFAGRRTGAAITDFAEVVATLAATAGHFIDLGDAFG